MLLGLQIVLTFLWGNAQFLGEIRALQKEGFPTLAYSMTCDHTRKILHCTGGFPGSYNDKTIARYDSFITDVGQNKMYTDFTYNIRTKEGVIQEKGL